MAKKIIHTIKKIIGWFLLCLLVILIATGIFVVLKAPAYLNENLSDWVAKKTGGTYNLQFDELSLSIRNWGFTFENIKLQPVDSIINRADSTNSKKVYYKFSSSELKIQNIALAKLFISQELQIGKIEIINPELQVSETKIDEPMSEKDIQLLTKQFEPILRKKLRSVRIKSIELIDAKYNSYNFLHKSGKSSNAVHISIGVKNFYTDSLLLPNPDRIFDADDVFVKMTDYKYLLNDSMHILSADEFYYSLKKAHITGTNVLLQPIDTTQNIKNKYLVKIPFLKLKSESISEFFTSDSIRIDSLYFDNAEIEFYPRPKSENITIENISDFDLYDLISDNFKNVAISHFMLNDAKLKLFNFKDNYFLQQKMEKMNLELTNVFLDSNSINNTDKIFYSDELSLAINGYKINLGDKNHQMEIGKLTANTYDKFVRIYDAKVRPILELTLKKNKKIAIVINCDSLKIREADLKQAFHSRKLPVGGIDIYRPITTINQYNSNQEKIKKSPNLAYEMISDYFQGVYASLVTLENGQLIANTFDNEKQTGHIQSGIDFHLTDFALDSLSANKSDKLFFATNIDLVFSKYEMQLVDQLHQLNVAKIEISSTKKKAVIEQLHLFPIAHENSRKILAEYGNSELYEVNIPFMYFLNTDIHQAFFNKKLTIGNIQIIEPKISFESFASLKSSNKQDVGIDEFYQLLSNYIKDIGIKQIEAKNGLLKLTNHSKKGKTIGFDNRFNLILEKFRLNKEEIGKRKLFFSEDIDLRIKKYLFRLSDNVHYLQAGEIGLSTFDSKVYVNNAILYPDITNPNYQKLPWNIHISIPSVSISEVDLLSLYFDQKLLAENLNINLPHIKLYKGTSKNKKTDFKDFSILLPNKIKLISIKDFQIKRGEIQVFSEVSSKNKSFMSGLINSQTTNLKIMSDPDNNKSQQISGLFTTTLKNLWYEPIDKNQRIELESIEYSTNLKNIRLKNLSIAPKVQTTTKNQFKLMVPEMQLLLFNIDLAYKKDQYKFGKINLSNPEFTFYKNVNDTSRFNPYTTDLYPYFKDYADVFSTEQLNLENASFILKKKNKTFEQRGVDLNLKGFQVDKNNDRRFLFSDQFSFNFNNVTRFDSKNHYKYKFDKLSYSSTDQNFTIKGIHIDPQFSKEKYSQLINYQTDYFKGDLQEISFEKMDLERWFEKRELVGERLQFTNLSLDVYRDKQVPFNEKQRPAMPPDLLRNFDLKFYFDSLDLINANISYAEKLENSIEAGRIDFKNAYARLKPFTNIPYLVGITGNSQIDVHGNLMGGPEISAHITLDMLSPSNSFELNGSIAPCAMNILNPMTIPAAFMEINSGILDKFEFHLTGDNEMAKGKLKFAYNDLNISIMEIKDGSAKKSKFSSFMANNLMLRSKNPRGKILLPDDINYKRDPSRSILNYWWKSIFDGVKNTFGIKDKKEE